MKSYSRFTFIVEGDVDKDYKPEFDSFVKTLNSFFVNLAREGKISSITLEFVVIDDEGIEKDE